MKSLFAIFAILLSGCKTEPAQEQVSYDESIPASISFSTGPNHDMGVMAVGSTKSFVVVLTNRGSLPMLDMEYILNEKATLKFTGDAFPGRQGDCGHALEPKESCKLELFAYSNELKALRETLGINYKNGIGPAYTELTVSGYFGNPAVLKPSVVSYDFGNVEPGASASALVSLKNTGELPAKELTGFTMTEAGDGNDVFGFTGGSFPGINGTCSDTLQPGLECVVEIEASPVSDNTPYTGSFQIGYVNPSAAKSASVPLALFGAEFKAYLKVEIKDGALPQFDTAVNNDAVNAPELTFTLTNTGYADAGAVAFQSGGDINAVQSASTCPAQLAPEQSCEITLQHLPSIPYPIDPGLDIPVKHKDQEFIFEYNDGKYPDLAQTQPVLISADVILEGNIFLQRNGDVNQSFDPDPAPLTKNFVWPSDQFDMIVGNSPIVRTLKIIAGQAGKNTDITGLTFEMLPDNNGFLTLSCLTAADCPDTIYAGNNKTVELRYNPTAGEEKDYQLKISYNDGTKNKEVFIDISARAQAIPIISVSGVPEVNGDPQTREFHTSGLYNVEQSQTITITNTGISGFTPADHIVQDTGGDHAYFTVDASLCATPIANGSSCDVVYTFLKNGDQLEKPFTEHYHTNFFTFNNGLASSDPSYKEWSVKMFGHIVERGYYEAAGGTVDFGAVPFSTGSQTGGSDKSFTQSFDISDASLRGSHKRNHFKFELTGEESALFSVVAPSGEGASIISASGEDVGAAEANRSVQISFSSPESNYDLGVDGIATATLTISYHGRGQDASSIDYEPEVITINIQASPEAQAWYEIADEGYNAGNPRSPFSAELIGNTSSLVDAAASTFTIKNTGLVDSNLGVSSVLRTALEDGSPDIHYKLRAVNSSDACFSHHQQIDDQTVEFKINALSECEFEVYDYSPDGYGVLNEKVSLDWQKDSIVTASSGFSGIGFEKADLAFSPLTGSGLAFYPVGEIKLGETLTPAANPFLVRSSTDNRFVMPGEIVSATVLSDPADSPDCSLPTNMPPIWDGYTSVYKPSSFSVTSNTCPGVSIHPGEPADGDPPPYFSGTQTDCGLAFTFTPQHIGKVETACVEVVYKKTPSETVPSGKIVLTLGGAGKVPETIFKGWKHILAEGETLDTDAFGEISWNPMEVEDGLGSVIAYRVYRKTKGEPVFADEPLAEIGSASFDASCSCYKFRNTVNQEELPEPTLLEPLAAEKVYQYKVTAKINVPGEGDFWSPTQAGSPDEVAKLFIPGPYQSFVHRWTANQVSCLEYLRKSYADLDRGANYSCAYTGDLSNYGVYDLGGNLLIDKYETGSDSPSSLTYLPGFAPAKLTSLSAAKDYCSSRSMTIGELNLYGEAMRLVNRRDFILASTGTDPETCVKSSSSAGSSGPQRCKSLFGVHDMIGNRWDIVDDFMLVDQNYDWYFDTGTMFEGDDYFFNINVLDLNSYSAVNYDTHTDYFSYDTNIPCFSPLLNRPYYSLGGICPESKGQYYFTDLSSQEMSDYDPLKRYIIFPQHEAELGEAFAPKRHLMMGGSYRSESRFGVPATQRSVYWTNPESEAVLMQSNPNGGYEGGAPRCVLEFEF